MFNPTNFLKNISSVARTERRFIHNVTENIPVIREFGAGVEDIFQGIETGAAYASKFSEQIISADKQEVLSTSDLFNEIHIFGHDISIPKTQLEMLYNLGRKDPKAFESKIDKIGKTVNHVTGLVSSAN